MKINKLAIPLMLNNITSMVITLCDQAMIGRTYMEGFASVGIIGNNIYEITGVPKLTTYIIYLTDQLVLVANKTLYTPFFLEKHHNTLPWMIARVYRS